jgi:asparagine synthase (glutamine-hydrolysing)
MSVQFGIWNQDGRPFDHHHVERAETLLAPYGPDGWRCHRQPDIAISYHAFHTTQESRREIQPYVTGSGSIITWDGRLDNRQELIAQCNDGLNPSATDVEIVAAAYQKWGTGSFAKLIGDWALSVCSPSHRLLILAKDPIGTRHLYYTFEKDRVSWSSILDPLVLLAGKTFELDEEYIAGWLSFFPATHLTPYLGIHAVPPSTFVLIRSGKHTVSKYWDFDPGKKILYRTDAEYEDHFRSVFRQSVRRRLRSDSPVLAELSGGMDSSSIVCMADEIIAGKKAETPRLHTVSYYDNSEPNWNERPYFMKVEEKRGQQGCHIDVGVQQALSFDFDPDFSATPAVRSPHGAVARKLSGLITSCGNRVVLSGIGGDELTGGVPTPVPELADLLTSVQGLRLARQLKSWALSKRMPVVHLLWQLIRAFSPSRFVGVPRHKRPASWLHQAFIHRHRAALQGYERRFRLFGPRPSFQENMSVLQFLRRQITSSPPSAEPLYEKRYPYLDTEMIQFLCGVPRHQLVRPGQRRSLMRRALIGIVPDELLNRKRKAFVGRAILVAIAAELPSLISAARHLQLSDRGIVDAEAFCETLVKAGGGQDVPLTTLWRSIYLESWIRNLRRRNLLSDSPPCCQLELATARAER